MKGWKDIARTLGLLLVTLVVSFSVVHALTSAVARLFMDVNTLNWLESTRFLRYVLTVLLTALIHLWLLSFRLQPSPTHWVHRQSLRKDMLLGYRVGVLWFICVLILFASGVRELSLSTTWASHGIATLAGIIVVASVEHWVWRGWFYSLLRPKFSRFNAAFAVSVLWLIQRLLFYGLVPWATTGSLLMEMFLSVVMVEILGVGGVWVFMLMWMGSLYGFLGLPFMQREMSGLFYMQFSLSQELMDTLSKYLPALIKQPEAVVAGLLPLIAAIFVVLGLSAVAPLLKRRIN